MARRIRKREIINYQTPEGREPFQEWLDSLRSVKTEDRITARLLRVAQGNLGDHASVGDGVWELRLFFGPGYRIYYAEEGTHIVILLLGGNKSSQSRDVRRAKAYWKEYRER